MLILQRRKSEVIHIGDQIKITLIGMANGVASIGIDAPKDINIVREEIIEKYSKEPVKQKRL